MGRDVILHISTFVRARDFLKRLRLDRVLGISLGLWYACSNRSYRNRVALYPWLLRAATDGSQPWDYRVALSDSSIWRVGVLRGRESAIRCDAMRSTPEAKQELSLKGPKVEWQR